MRVKMEFFGFPVLSQVLGKQEIWIELEEEVAESIHDVIGALVSGYGAEVGRLLFTENGTLNPYVQVILNKTNWIPRYMCSEALIRDGDTIKLLPLPTGG